MPGVCPVTVGIGVLCDGGKTAILASDMRVTYRNKFLPPSDHCGKQYDFAPLLLAASVAGNPAVCQPVIAMIAENLGNLLYEKQKNPERLLVMDHVRLVVEHARKRELRMLQGCAMERELGVSLAEWQTGKLPNSDKLDPLALKCGRAVLQRVSEGFKGEMGLIVVGFVENGPVFFCAQGAEPLMQGANPEYYAIGSGAAAATDVLIRRGQNIYLTMARSLFHVHEALQAARRSERTVGPPSPYVVIRPPAMLAQAGMFRFPAKCDLLKGWDKAYKKRKSTASLDGDVPKVQATGLLRKHEPDESQLLSDFKFASWSGTVPG